MSPRSSSSSQRSSKSSPKHSPKQGHTVFYGRGGAGNAKQETEQAPPPDLGTPTLKSQVYTTGRGGAGNMAKNDLEHPEKARERQDVDVPHVALEPERNYTVGRGGAGNVHHLTNKERADAKEHNDRIRADSGKGNSTARDHVRDLAAKAKGVFGGSKPASIKSA